MYTVPVLINNTLTSPQTRKSSKTGCILVIHPVFYAKIIKSCMSMYKLIQYLIFLSFILVGVSVW